MTPEEEIKWFKGQNQILKDKIDELDKNRIHCRQCHSTNIKLTQKIEKETQEGFYYDFECIDCKFKEIRYISHSVLL